MSVRVARTLLRRADCKWGVQQFQMISGKRRPAQNVHMIVLFLNGKGHKKCFYCGGREGICCVSHLFVLEHHLFFYQFNWEAQHSVFTQGGTSAAHYHAAASGAALRRFTKLMPTPLSDKVGPPFSMTKASSSFLATFTSLVSLAQLLD